MSVRVLKFLYSFRHQYKNKYVPSAMKKNFLRKKEEDYNTSIQRLEQAYKDLSDAKKKK